MATIKYGIDVIQVDWFSDFAVQLSAFDIDFFWGHFRGLYNGFKNINHAENLYVRRNAFEYKKDSE